MAYARQLKKERVWPDGRKSRPWQGVYRDPRGKKRYIGPFQTKGKAEAEANREQLKIGDGQWTDPDGGKITVREWSETWLKGRNASEKTLASNRQLLRTLVLPRWCDTPLNAITYTDVREWVNTMTGSRGQPLAPSTVRDAHWILANMLALAVDDRRLISNPAFSASGKIKLPKRAKHKDHIYLDHRQLHRLATVAREPYGVMILFMGYTGLRPGEATALTVADFNMLKRRVSVTKAYTSVDGAKEGERSRLILKDTKTGEQRTVTFPTALTKPLAVLMEGKSRDELVFTAPMGGPWEYKNLYNRIIKPAVKLASTAVSRLQGALDVTPVDGKFGESTQEALRRFQAAQGLAVDGVTSPEVWKALAVEQAGVRDSQALVALAPVTLQLGDENFNPRMTTYDLRHTAASLAISSGANIKHVQQMLGHAKASMTLDVYGGLFDSDVDRVAERLDAAIGDVTLGSALSGSSSKGSPREPLRASLRDALPLGSL